MIKLGKDVKELINVSLQKYTDELKEKAFLQCKELL